MDPNFWASLRSSQDPKRNGHTSGNEQTFSLAPSAGNTLNTISGIELLFLERQRLAASGFAAGFLSQQPTLLAPAAYGNYNIQCSTGGGLYLPYNTISAGENADGISAGAQFALASQPQFESLLKAHQQQQQQQQPMTTNTTYSMKHDTSYPSQVSKSSAPSIPKRPASSQPAENALLTCRSYAGSVNSAVNQQQHSTQSTIMGSTTNNHHNLDIRNQPILTTPILSLASRQYDNKQQSMNTLHSLPRLDLSQLTAKSTASSGQSRPIAHSTMTDQYASSHTPVTETSTFKASPAVVSVSPHLGQLVDQSAASLQWTSSNQMHIGTADGLLYEAVSPAPLDSQSYSFIDSLQLFNGSDCTGVDGLPVYLRNICDGTSLALQSQANASNPTGVAIDHQTYEQASVYYAEKLSNVDSAVSGLDQCRQSQKSKPGTEVGVVLPIPQSRSVTKQLSSNPLIALPSTFDLMDANNLGVSHCNFERDYYEVPGPVNYLSDNLSKDDVGCGADDARSNSAIVLSNITGNVYINQYSMLQSDSGENPLMHPVGLSYDSYSQLDEEEEDKNDEKSLLLVPNERDDEFGHLTAPESPQPDQTAISGYPQNESTAPPKVPKAIPKSAFENSFLKFVCGHQTETLSSVTNSPIKNRPPLPKYIPDTRKAKTVEIPVEESKPAAVKNDESSVKTAGSPVPPSADVEKVDGADLTVAAPTPSITVTTTKFPAKFSHKLQSRAQKAMAESAAATAAVVVPEESSASKGFKWKKMITTTATSDDVQIVNSKSKASTALSTHGQPDQLPIKGKRPVSSTSQDIHSQGSNKMMAQQVQWTVSKKPKEDVGLGDASRVPVLVIKAVPSASTTETKVKKSLGNSKKPSK